MLLSVVHTHSIPDDYYTHNIPDDDNKIVETLKIEMVSIFGVTIVVYLIKILCGYRNFWKILK